jgi:ElaB/YqjD/DUF883 family membrane-anchored ribosome-binding protein
MAMATLIKVRTVGMALALLPLFSICGCSQTYYAVWEKLGWEKRDILVDRVKDARNDQEKAKEQFQTTLQRFRAVAGTEGNPDEDALQSRYDKLKSDYDSCEARATKLKDRVNSVDEVAHDLFKEWEGELNQYHDQSLRDSSEKMLHDTQDRYDQLIGAMRRAVAKMDPVLGAFHDQVLFLKHNLNARAIASLETTKSSVETDVAELIKEMDASIAEADSFINEMASKK